jgi:putative transcriptional regulator
MNQIKIVLEEKRIKQTWLAEKLDKSYKMVNSCVQNRRHPSLEVLNKIVDLINIDIKDLIVNSKNG